MSSARKVTKVTKVKIRRGDEVKVIAGDDRGATGKVLRVLREDNKVVVEGVNKVYKHVRPTQRNPKGGRVSKEMPIHVSNVLLYDSELGRGVRVGTKTDAEGNKVRVSRKTKRELGVVRPARRTGEGS